MLKEEHNNIKNKKHNLNNWARSSSSIPYYEARIIAYATKFLSTSAKHNNVRTRSIIQNFQVIVSPRQCQELKG